MLLWVLYRPQQRIEWLPASYPFHSAWIRSIHRALLLYLYEILCLKISFSSPYKRTATGRLAHRTKAVDGPIAFSSNTKYWMFIGEAIFSARGIVFLSMIWSFSPSFCLFDPGHAFDSSSSSLPFLVSFVSLQAFLSLIHQTKFSVG